MLPGARIDFFTEKNANGGLWMFFASSLFSARDDITQILNKQTGEAADKVPTGSYICGCFYLLSKAEFHEELPP